MSRGSWRTFLVSALMLTSSLAFAGYEQEGFYNSNLGYRVKAPVGWQRLDDATRQALLNRLPNALKNLSIPFDVLFFPGDQTGTLSNDSVSILITDKSFTKLRGGLADAMSTEIQNAKNLADSSISFRNKGANSEDEQVAGAPTLVVEYGLKSSRFEGKVRQYLVKGRNVTLIITCMMSAQSMYTAREACDSVAKSLDLGSL